MGYFRPERGIIGNIELAFRRTASVEKDTEKNAEIAAAQLGGQYNAQAAEQQRKVLQMFAASLSDNQAMEVATVFDSWYVGRIFSGGEYFTYGVNSVGDPQLYKVNDGKPHTAHADWIPGTPETASLYTAIGLDESGYPVWSRPTGAHDAYNKGDIVNFNGTRYISLMDGNTYSPDEYPAGWEIYVEEVIP